ncbi:hypothetical protein ACVWW1_003379 [Bradyrhizobium sp. JR3.5]
MQPESSLSIQTIKGWIGADGAPQEKIVDIAWSGNRKIPLDGKLPRVANTVALKTATTKIRRAAHN